MKTIVKNIKTIVGVMAFFTSLTISAQQLPQYTQYMYNTMTLNSGYTGTRGPFEGTLLHRSQWVGLDGAPSTQVLSLHGTAGQRVGLGISAVNESIGPADQVDVSAAFAYKLKLSNTATLSLGVNAGVNMLNVDWSKGIYLNQQDAIFNQNINNQIRPMIGAGAFFYTNKWYLGLSVPNFINADIYDDEEEVVLKDEMHYYAMAGYVFHFSDNLLFKPAAMAKVVEGAPITVDLSANFLIAEKLTLGAAYRFDDAASGLAGFQLSKSLFIGYSYDYNTSDLNKYNDGSHEIILRFNIAPKSKNAISPRFF